MATDVLGRKLALNDLIAWGHSGRHAGTRIGRVYKIEGRYVRAWIFERGERFDHEKKRTVRTWEWERTGHAAPHDPVKLEEVGNVPPELDDAQLKRET